MGRWIHDLGASGEWLGGKCKEIVLSRVSEVVVEAARETECFVARWFQP